MKLLKTLVVCFLISNLSFAQNASPGPGQSSDEKIANQIKSLQDAIASQQQQIQALQQELAGRRQAEATPHVANASLTTGAPSANTTLAQ